MRLTSLILIALGVFLLVHSAFDEIRGTTHKPYHWLGIRRYNSWYLYSIPVQRDKNPELFHEFMTTHWIYAGLVSGIGCALYLTNRPSKED